MSKAAKLGKSRKGPSSSKKTDRPSLLKKGDKVMVIAGGSGTKKALKGTTGKILKFVGLDRQRAVVEGLNFVARHQRARSANQQSGRIVKEAPIHIARLMYFAEDLKKPVKLCTGLLADGTKVRGYKDKQTKSFVQISE